MSHGDAHIYTAIAYYIIGVIMLALAVSVWWTHPVNRVFIFGRYLTQEGVRVVMMSWPIVALFGAFIFSCAVDHHVDWLYVGGRVSLRNTLIFVSIVEAVISWITALAIMFFGARWLVKLLWHR